MTKLMIAIRLAQAYTHYHAHSHVVLYTRIYDAYRVCRILRAKREA